MPEDTRESCDLLLPERVLRAKGAGSAALLYSLLIHLRPKGEEGKRTWVYWSKAAAEEQAHRLGMSPWTARRAFQELRDSGCLCPFSEEDGSLTPGKWSFLDESRNEVDPGDWAQEAFYLPWWIACLPLRGGVSAEAKCVWAVMRRQETWDRKRSDSSIRFMVEHWKLQIHPHAVPPMTWQLVRLRLVEPEYRRGRPTVYTCVPSNEEWGKLVPLPDRVKKRDLVTDLSPGGGVRSVTRGEQTTVTSEQTTVTSEQTTVTSRSKLLSEERDVFPKSEIPERDPGARPETRSARPAHTGGVPSGGLRERPREDLEYTRLSHISTHRRVA